jgi:hypothetical protein
VCACRITSTVFRYSRTLSEIGMGVTYNTTATTYNRSSLAAFSSKTISLLRKVQSRLTTPQASWFCPRVAVAAYLSKTDLSHAKKSATETDHRFDGLVRRLVFAWHFRPRQYYILRGYQTDSYIGLGDFGCR